MSVRRRAGRLASDQIDLVLEAGVNMIDTADVYSMGKT